MSPYLYSAKSYLDIIALINSTVYKCRVGNFRPESNRADASLHFSSSIQKSDRVIMLFLKVVGSISGICSSYGNDSDDLE
ncbi:MAG: hypothetical protein M3270_04075 [Thermoproteota archaeon]|nr:hypothetical protein [Thermoproteota archaeon]